MARRSTATDLAGLAGLATLGYQLLKGNKQDVPVETLQPEAKAEPDYGEDYAREVARGQRGPIAVGSAKSVRAASAESSKTPEKTSAADKRDLERGTSRGRPSTGPVRTTMGARYDAETSAAPTPTPTGGDLASQIPGSAPAGWQGGVGDRVTGNELTRNVGNTAAALGAATGAGALNPALRSLANLGMYGRGSQAAAQLENAATRQLSNAPTRQLTGPSKADIVARDRAARAAARQEEMLKENARRYGLDPSAPGYEGAASAVRRGLGGDEFAVMKKGGSTRKAAAKKTYAKGGAVKKETKPKAKGWGMARGGRAAKIY